MLPGAGEALVRLAEKLAIHVMTADTFGRARKALAGIPCELVILTEGAQDAAKLRYVKAPAKPAAYASATAATTA